MNNGTYIIKLGAEPETIQLGKVEGRKLRCADWTPGKKSVTRWFNAIVTGRDCETADSLTTGAKLVLAGQLVLEEYSPKKPRFKGEKVRVDVMPFAKIIEVISGKKEADEDADAGVAETSDPLTEASPLDGADGADGADDPLADVG